MSHDTRLLKPSPCIGCPAYGDGVGFVPDELRDDAEVLFMFQNPGDMEEKGIKVVGRRGKDTITEPYHPAPLIGATGLELEQHYLPLAGLSRETCSFGNVQRCRLNHTNKLHDKPSVQEAIIAHCQRAHGRIPSKTRLIVASGNPAKWAMTGKGSVRTGIEEWRGWLAPLRPPYELGQTLDTSIYLPQPGEVPVLMTLHLADLFRDPMMKTPTKADFTKIRRVLDGKWPRPIPEVKSTCEPGMWVDGVVFDTEYDPRFVSRELHRYNVFTPTGGLWVIEAMNHDRATIPDRPLHLIGQNFYTADDLSHAAALGIRWGRLDDIMGMHAVLWPGMPHDLDFQASMYARTNRWKHLSQTNPFEYAAGDPVGTMDCFRHLSGEMDRQPWARKTYETYVRPLIPVIHKRHVRGLQVDTKMATKLAKRLDAEIEEIVTRAQSTVGWPINLGSGHQVAWQLYKDLSYLPSRRRAKR